MTQREIVKEAFLTSDREVAEKYNLPLSHVRYLRKTKFKLKKRNRQNRFTAERNLKQHSDFLYTLNKGRAFIEERNFLLH